MFELDFEELKKTIDWDIFIDRMVHEDYILVLGPEVILEDWQNVREWEKFVESQIKAKNLYNIRDLYKNKKLTIKIEDVARNIHDLIKTRCFKIVITTIVHPFIEKVFDEVWGRDEKGIPNYDIYSYAVRDSKYSDINNIESFISGGDYRPAIVYLLGNMWDRSIDNLKDEDKEKYKEWRLARESKKIARNEIDFMEAISHWLVPRRLHKLLETRKLLVLGGKYDDWAFRFMMYALKGFDYEPKDEAETKSEISISLNRNYPSDVSLREYLEASRIYVSDEETRNFIDEILTKYHYYHKKLKRKREEESLEGSYDVFLSYASEDSAIAHRLYRSLIHKGLKIWMDFPMDEKANIAPFERYKEVIENAIKRSFTFVPLISKNTKKALEEDLSVEEKDRRFFHRVEWKNAQILGKEIFPVVAGIMSRAELRLVGYGEAAKIFWTDDKKREEKEVQVGFLSDGVELLVNKINEVKQGK